VIGFAAMGVMALYVILDIEFPRFLGDLERGWCCGAEKGRSALEKNLV
jgi:hypothetical protein